VQAAPPLPAEARALGADEAVARQRDGLRKTMGLGCIREEGEIVVCAPLARGGIPFPEEEGARKRLIAGEINDPGAISHIGSCCGGHSGLDVLKIGEVAGKILGKIF
jgi:hypothetical protein